MKSLSFVAVCFFFLTESEAVEQPKDSFLEISPYVSLYSGDALRSNILGGAALTYHFNRTYWVGADFVGGTTHADSNNGFGIRNNEKYLASDVAFYMNLPALLGSSAKEGKGIPADLYSSFGVGYLWADGQREPFGLVGGGLLVHTGLAWLAVRFDLKGIFFVLTNAKGMDFNSDMTLDIGPSFKF